MKILFIALLLVLMLPLDAAAEMADYGQDELMSALPPEAANALENGGITPDSGGAVSFEGAMNALWQLIIDNVQEPLRLAAGLVGVALLAGLSKSMADNTEGSMSRVFGAVGVLAGAAMTVSAIGSCLSEITELLQQVSVFMLTFIPIYAGILAIMGRAAAASAINMTVLAATQLFSQLAVNLLMPLCGTVLGLSVTGAVHSELHTDKLGELIKKLVVWSLGLLMTVFMGVLSMQTFSANAADNVLLRTAKLAVSTGVPIVGGTISDAVGTVAGSLELLKSTVGTFGIAAAAVMIAPTFITVAGYRLALAAAQAAADILGAKELSSLYASCGSVMAILTAVMSCFLLMNVIAVLIMLSLGVGGA